MSYNDNVLDKDEEGEEKIDEMGVEKNYGAEEEEEDDYFYNNSEQ
ncbi:MAG: hypothetical protein UV08_C0004G0010 [Parcubacteria group bacterium GW2011_GWA2_42_18]|nr:MAG: hypothetical protein UV08_C0004G0010 [Parcubacteria group bacterium GW2011_GWA2_42_18]KKT75742.1 MAG: hypothetical protein UW72_C0019G0009 [Parcubacteria group bacterium GW2011_GWF2_44_7]